MDETQISLVRLPYDDTAWRIQLQASNGEFAGMLKFYIDGTDLIEFARRLCVFPSTLQDEACFRLGDRGESWAYYLSLRAFVFDRSGHTALEIEIDNREVGHQRGRAAFAIRCEVASLNELGRKLVAWIDRPDEMLVWRPCWS